MKLPSNHRRHPLQGPHVRGEAKGGGADEQRRGQLPAGVRIQAGLAPGATGRPQPRAAQPPLGVIPAARRLPTDSEPMHDAGGRMTLFEQLGGPHPASFQGRKVAPGPKAGVHTPSLTRTPTRLTIL